MKKICFLVGYYPINRGGSEYQAYLLAQKLRKWFEIFYISVGQSKEEKIIDNGITIYTLQSPKIFYVKNAYFLLKSKIFKILKYENPDFVYQRVAYSVTGIAAQYCKGHRCKLIWHIANKPDVEVQRVHFSKRILIDYIEKKYLEYGIKNADYIIGQEEYHSQMISKNYGRKCTAIINKFLPVEKKEIVKKLPIKIIWIANVKPAKQPELFIKLASRFMSNKNLSFIMVGRPAGGDYHRYLIKQIQKVKNLRYLGELPIDEVNDILCDSHVFVNTSLYEGGPPNTFIQAWMRETPTVSLNTDPDNIIKKNKLGFHSGSFEQMVKDVRFLIQHPRIREKMGRRARKYAISEYDINKIIPKYSKLFISLSDI